MLGEGTLAPTASQNRLNTSWTPGFRFGLILKVKFLSSLDLTAVNWKTGQQPASLGCCEKLPYMSGSSTSLPHIRRRPTASKREFWAGSRFSLLYPLGCVSGG